MDVRHAAAFVNVADERHFGRAGRRLNIAQPAVSRLVRRLEDELDVVLFERSSHGVMLTAAGTELLPHARALVEVHDRLLAVARGMSTGRRGRLRLGTTAGMGPRLTALLEHFAAAAPDIRVELHPASTPVKLDRLRRGELDLALVRQASPAADVRLQPLWSDPLVAVIPAGHRQAVREHVDPATLGLPLLLAEQASNPGVHAVLRAAAGGAAGPIRTGVFAGYEEALATIASGAAWSILYADQAEVRPGIAVRALPRPTAIDVSLAWLAEARSPTIQLFTHVARVARTDGAFARRDS